VQFYGAGDLVGYDELSSVPAWLDRAVARPAVERGLLIPQRPA
jgi:GST-like protein